MLRLHIKRRRGIVQHKDGISLGQCPCDTDPLFLSAGQTHTTLSDHRVIGLIHALDKSARLRLIGSFPDRLKIYVLFLTQLNIVINRIRKQEYVLHHVAYTGTKLLQGHILNIHIIQIDGSVRGIIHALQKLYDGSLPGTGSAHNPQRPARLHRKGYVMQNLILICFME